MTSIYIRLNRAIEECEQAALTSELEKWYGGCSHVSNLLASMGRFDESSIWNSMAVASQPNIARYYAETARLFVLQEAWEQALTSYHRALELQPKFIEAHQFLAQIYFQVGNNKARLKHWYEFLSQRPERGTAESHYKLAQAFHDDQQLDYAATCYEQAIGRNPQYVNAYYGLAEVWMLQKDWDKAVDCYERLIQVDGQQIKAYYQLGKVCLQQKTYAKAIAVFKTATQLNPQFAWAYLGLVQTFMALERWDEAIATCHAVIEFVDAFPWTYSNMGKAWMKKGEVEQAIDCYQKVAQLQGWDACTEKDYHFTQDAFTNQIPLWHKHLQPLQNKEAVSGLEIGSGQGMTACWLLDTVITTDRSQLTCIDQQFSETFGSNLKKTGASHKVTQLEGKPHPFLESLRPNSYDLITIQDRCKRANYLKKDARLSWPLLKTGGFMVFKDYKWQHPDGPDHSPKTGIDQFLGTISGQFDILYQAYQLIIQKS